MLSRILISLALLFWLCPPAQGQELTHRQVIVVPPLRLIKAPKAEMPPLARAAHASGVVQMEAVVDKDGHVASLRVLSGKWLLIPAAIAAAKQYLYAPTVLNGVPVEIATTIELNFREFVPVELMK